MGICISFTPPGKNVNVSVVSYTPLKKINLIVTWYQLYAGGGGGVRVPRAHIPSGKFKKKLKNPLQKLKIGFERCGNKSNV